MPVASSTINCFSVTNCLRSDLPSSPLASLVAASNRSKNGQPVATGRPWLLLACPLICCLAEAWATPRQVGVLATLFLYLAMRHRGHQLVSLVVLLVVFGLRVETYRQMKKTPSHFDLAVCSLTKRLSKHLGVRWARSI